MKARVKATGEMVEISTFQDNNKIPTTYDENELEFLIPNDYWTRLEHQYAGMVMQALIVEYRNAQSRHGFSESIIQETCAKECIQFAHTLVKKLKEERK